MYEEYDIVSEHDDYRGYILMSFSRALRGNKSLLLRSVDLIQDLDDEEIIRLKEYLLPNHNTFLKKDNTIEEVN